MLNIDNIHNNTETREEIIVRNKFTFEEHIFSINQINIEFIMKSKMIIKSKYTIIQSPIILYNNQVKEFVIKKEK